MCTGTVSFPIPILFCFFHARPLHPTPPQPHPTLPTPTSCILFQLLWCREVSASVCPWDAAGSFHLSEGPWCPPSGKPECQRVVFLHLRPTKGTNKEKRKKKKKEVICSLLNLSLSLLSLSLSLSLSPLSLSLSLSLSFHLFFVVAGCLFAFVFVFGSVRRDMLETASCLQSPLESIAWRREAWKDAALDDKDSLKGTREGHRQ